MNNGDKPINPVRGATGVPFNTNDGHEKHVIASMNEEGVNDDIAVASVLMADALLKQLEPPKENKG